MPGGIVPLMGNGVAGFFITFYHEDYLYLYVTTLSSVATLSNQASFGNEHIYRKKYYKTYVDDIFEKSSYEEMTDLGDLPEDTSNVFFILKRKQTRAVFFDSHVEGADTYQLLFRTLKNYNIGPDVLGKIIKVFDENIQELISLDDHNYRIVTKRE